MRTALNEQGAANLPPRVAFSLVRQSPLRDLGSIAAVGFTNNDLHLGLLSP